MKKLIFAIICLSVAFSFSLCRKKNKDDCKLNCLNGGSCVNNACNCPADWSGQNCENYNIYKFEGI